MAVRGFVKENEKRMCPYLETIPPVLQQETFSDSDVSS